MPFEPDAMPESLGRFVPDDEGAPPTQQVKPDRSWAQVAADTGVDLAKGVVGLGESAVGLTDLVTGNLTGKGLGWLGYDPARTKQALSDLYSDQRQQANRSVADAKGFIDTTAALLQNPMAIAGGVAESAPMLLGTVGAVRTAAAKMLASRGLTAGTAEAGAFLANPATIAKLTAIGGATEGAMTAGNIQEQGRQAGRDYTDTAPAAVAGGALTGAISILSSKIPGFRDVEVTAATAGLGGTQRTSLLAAGKEIAKGTFKEGVLEEMPQSAQEQVFTNLALGKPWEEGVPEAAAQGMVVGAAQGGGMNVYSVGRNAMAGSAAPPETPPATPPAPTIAAREALKQNDPDTTAAEKALLTPVVLTALDRVNEIDQEAGALSARAEELNRPESDYGPMFDQERTELATRQQELADERAELAKDWPNSVSGLPSSFTTEAGARVNANYALMDAGDLITSHDEGLRKNPLYPPELQPRERDRAASEMQVSGIVQKLDPARLGLSADAANGAPIVGADGLVESGNARTIALKRVYQSNDGKGDAGQGSQAHLYREFLKANAAQFGITPESVDGMAKPVLVRMRTTPVNRAEFARQANASTVAAMAPSEQAKSDANRIESMDDLTPDDNGDFSNVASKPFVRRFMARLPITEQSGMIDSGGNLSTTGYARVRNAVLAKAYGDPPVLARMTESMDDNLRNVSRAFMLAAPKVAVMRAAIKAGTRFDADITPDMMSASEELARIKTEGGSVADALAQTDIMGDQRTPEAHQLLQFLNDNMRRPRKMADFIGAYMDALDAAGDPKQGSLLGDTQAPTKQDLLKAAERATNETTNPGAAAQGAAQPTGGQTGQEPVHAPGSGSSPQGHGADASTATQGGARQASQPVSAPAAPTQWSGADAAPLVTGDAVAWLVNGKRASGEVVRAPDARGSVTVRAIGAEMGAGVKSGGVFNVPLAKLEALPKAVDVQAPAKQDLLTAAEKVTQNEVQNGGSESVGADAKTGTQAQPQGTPNAQATALQTDGTANNYSKWMENVGQKLQQEGWAQNVLDTMVENEESPQQTAATFWTNTYPRMNEQAQRAFKRMYKGHTGQSLEVGGNPMDMIDLGNKAEYLEGTDRGFVALMREANSRRPDDLKQISQAQEGQQKTSGQPGKGWLAFPGNTGTLRIPRAEMPQVKAEHRGALISFLKAQGIEHQSGELAPQEIKPTQAEFSPAKVEKFQQATIKKERSVLVSSDGYVLDGHHQWLAHLAEKAPVKVIQFDAPIRDLLAKVAEFPSVGASDGTTTVSARDTAAQDFKDALADLAQIATRHTRVAMMPENTPELMPTLVKLMTAGKEVGYELRDLVKYVKEALKTDERFKTFWNKISNETYQKAALQAMESGPADSGDLFGQLSSPNQGGLFDGLDHASPVKAPAKPADKPIPDGWALAANGKGYVDERGFARGFTMSDKERAAEQAFYDAIFNDTNALIERYLSEVLKPEDGLLVDPDRIKELSREYMADLSLANAVHEPSSHLSKLIFTRLVKANADKPVIFTAGGGGSGKTGAMGLAAKVAGVNPKGVIFDSTLSNLESGVKKIDQVLVGGGKVEILYTNAPVKKAFAFAMQRPRVVKITDLAKAHQDASDTIRKMVEHYKGNPAVRIVLINNFGSKAEMHPGTIDQVPSYDYNQTERSLYEQAVQARDSGPENGGITRVRFEALTAGVRPVHTGDKQRLQSLPGSQSGSQLERLPGQPERNPRPGLQPSGAGGLNANHNDSQRAHEGQGAGAVPGAVAKRGAERLRDGAGGSDLFGGSDLGQTDSAETRLQQDAADRPHEGSGDHESVDVAGTREGVRRPAGVPAGRDIPAKSGLNYTFGDNDLTYEGSWQKKATQNVEAIELLKKLQTENRQAAPDEQKSLARFVGWGAGELANNLFGKKLDKAVTALSEYEGAAQAMGMLKRDYLQKGGQYRGQYADNGYYQAVGVLRAAGKVAVHEFPQRVTRAELSAAKPDATAQRWIELRDRLRAALTPEELAEASRSTQYAHYTSKGVVQSMWRAMERMGFKGGTILEPGAGIGVFPGLMPHGMAANSSYTGIEFDGITGAILKQLFPDERILTESFVDSKLPKNFYDVAAGNPPFSGTKILGDPEYSKQALSLHDYFFAKSIDRVKPGGLVMFVTSRYTMDKLSDKARGYLAERADLVGAIRLPQTAFKQNAGTDVTTDVIFLRKKVPGETFEQGQAWAKSVPIQAGAKTFPINEYFHAHPEMVLGKHSDAGKMQNSPEPQYTVTPLEGDIEAHFDKAVQNLPADIYQAQRGSAGEAAKVREIDFNPKAQKEGNYYVTDAGILMVREGGVGVRAEEVRSADAPMIKDFVPLRDALKQAHYDQLNNGDWETSLKKLQTAYVAFTKKHGNINQFTTRSVKVKSVDEETGETFTDEQDVRKFTLHEKLRDDPDSTLVMALENVNDDTGEITKSNFLTDRVLEKQAARKVATPHDALLTTLNDIGKVDMALIAQRIGLTHDQAIEALGTAVYDDPESGWTTDDDYLSGNVKAKLAAAQAAVQTDKRYERNVDALLAVQPEPLSPAEIDPNIGMNWIPSDVYEQFVRDITKGAVAASVNWDPTLKEWTVKAESGHQTDEATSEWGTSRRHVVDLLENALTGRPIKISTRQEGAKDATFDPGATEAANLKLAEIKEEFGKWVFKDQDRTDQLVRIYNDTFNTTVARKFDGRHLTLPGTSKTMGIFDHVKRGAWRIIQKGNTYLAHAVGSGKTYQMVISAMEQKRLGLVKKPMMVVPNHVLKQFASEWQQLYPAARLMVADENNFHKDNRRRFVSRVALSDLDGVIITHSAFKLLDLDPAFKAKMIGQQLEQFRAALEAAGGDVDAKGKSKGPKIKRIEKQVENLEQKLAAANSSEGKDQNVRFDELGVDFLYVDEAHEFRKLDYSTVRQVKGIDPVGSGKSHDLFMKSRWLEEKHPGRSLVMASGTPITNTVAELYTVQRFLGAQDLVERGIDDFDSWAAMFGREVTELEAGASGVYVPVTRFADFANVPELTQMFREFADVLNSDQLGEMLGDKRPKVHGGSRSMVITPMPSDYKTWRDEELRPRVEVSKKWRPSLAEPNNPDPIIKILGDARLAAADMRFINPSLPSNPDSKLNRMIDDVIAKFKETAGMEFKDKKGNIEPVKGAAMMVFADQGFGAGVAAHRGFNAKAWFEKRIRDAGIPASQFAFMSDYQKSTAKQKLFRDVNAGRVRILVGSSKNMGTGVNAQQRLKYLFHLDSPWYPADLEQREGRAVRTGNKNPVVNLNAYATKGTYEQDMWTGLARKQLFIDKALSGDKSVRKIEDLDGANLMAMASGLIADDPRVLQLAGLNATIGKYQRLYQAHEVDRARFRQKYSMASQTLSFNETRLPLAVNDAAKAQDLSGDNFTAKVLGQKFTERTKWGESLVAEFKKRADRADAQKLVVGEISGFPITYVAETVANVFRPALRLGTPTNTDLVTDAGTSPMGVAMRAQNDIAELGRLPEKIRERIGQAKAEMDSLTTKLDAKFQFAQALADSIAERDALEAELAQAADQNVPGPEVVLSRGSGSGMDVKALEDLAARIQKRMPNMPKVNVLASPATAATPKALREYIEQQGAMNDVDGALHDGELYLFASGLPDALRAEHVLAEHEAAHFGLRAILGDSLKDAMNMIWANNPQIRKAAAELQKRGKLSYAEATEEAIVDIPSSQLVQLHGWRKVVLKARDHLNKRGYTALAERLSAWLDGNLNDQQRADLLVADLVRAARDYMKGKQGGADTMLSGTLAEDWQKQEAWLRVEAQSRGYKDIDQLADKNYPLFEKLAELWRQKNPAKDGVLLSRAPAIRHSGTANGTAAERADAIIKTSAATAKPIDALAKGLTRITGVERLTRAIYGRAGYLLDRWTPETIKAGMVSDYGVPEAVIDQRALLQGRQRVQLRQAGSLIEKLATLTRAESRVAYEWMNETDPHTIYALMQNLPEDSVKVLMEVQGMIDKLSREAVRMGQLSPDAYERNKFAYLRRSYAKHTLNQTAGEKKARARAISILGDQYKGRGLNESATMVQIQNSAPEWWTRKLAKGKADTGLKGEKFLRLERRTASGERTKPLEGMEGKQPGKLKEVHYFPVSERLPAKYADWTPTGTFEVRDTKGANLILWRDFTKDERENMGEIDEARFAIAKTLHAMIHDVEVGRYLEWLAHSYAKKEGETIPGTVVNASERYADTFHPGEWVKVPDSKIQGTSVLKYGKLAGRYLPGPVWNDLRQTVNGQFKPLGDTYAKILSAWKISKTALSPAVHMNNIMSNFVMADWHEVTAGHTAKALRILLGAHEFDGKGLLGTAGNKVAGVVGTSDREAAREIMNRYLDSGGNIGSWATNEIGNRQIEPLLAAMEAELAVTNGNSVQAQIGVMSALQLMRHGQMGAAWDAAKKSTPGKFVGTEAGTLIDMYQSEDDVFRLAAWLKAKEEGKTDMEAGKIARRSFMDYHINAPWVQALRNSALPFISYTYRAVPMLLETAGKKPHKIMKLMLLAGALNALGAMLAGGDDDEERKLLPEEKAGRIWGMVPKLIRMPWNDAHSSPVYLDIRRFIPVGDVFDVGANHAAVPMLPMMTPGGPMVILGEIVLNKTGFTGKPITLETDTALQQTSKVMDYLYKAFAPNVLGLPGTYASTGVLNAAKGKTDAFGREQSVAQAMASSFGVKLASYPADVMRKNEHGKAQAMLMEIDRNISQLRRQRQTNSINDAEFQSQVQVEQDKKRKVQEKLMEKLGG